MATLSSNLGIGHSGLSGARSPQLEVSGFVFIAPFKVVI